MLVESLDLLAEQVRRSFVPEDEIGRGHFFHDRTLGRQNGFNHVLTESVPESQAGLLRFPGNGHHAHGILVVARRCFKKQGHVNDKPGYRRILTCRPHLRKTFLVQQGVNDSFQRPAAFRIPEDKLPQEVPVRAAVFIHAGGSEGAGEPLPKPAAVQQPACLRITVKKAQARPPLLHQQADGGGLSGGDSAGHDQRLHEGREKPGRCGP